MTDESGIAAANLAPLAMVTGNTAAGHVVSILVTVAWSIRRPWPIATAP